MRPRNSMPSQSFSRCPAVPLAPASSRGMTVGVENFPLRGEVRCTAMLPAEPAQGRNHLGWLDRLESGGPELGRIARAGWGATLLESFFVTHQSCSVWMKW